MLSRGKRFDPIRRYMNGKTYKTSHRQYKHCPKFYILEVFTEVAAKFSTF